MGPIILTGYSGSGKTEIGKMLQSRLSYEKAVTDTMRPIREVDGVPIEVDGVDYYFKKSKAEFDAVEHLECSEYPKGSGIYYGLSLNEISSKRGKKIYAILEIQGALAVKKAFPDAVIVFIECDKSILKERMIARGDEPNKIEKRLANMENSIESTTSQYADVILNNNGELEETFKALEEYISSL